MHKTILLFLLSLILCLNVSGCGNSSGGSSVIGGGGDRGGGGGGNKAFGTLKWSVAISDTPSGSDGPVVTPTYISSPAIAPDGTVYVGGTDHFLYALKPDGTVKWKYETGNSLFASPAVGSDGTIYIGSEDRQFYAINPNGTLKWIFPTKTVFTSSAAIGPDGTIYAAGTNQDKTIFPCSNTIGTCSVTKTRSCSSNSGCPAGETCVLGTSVIAQLSTIFAINPDGTEKWEFLVNTSGFSGVPGVSGPLNSSPALASDGKTLYIGSEGDFVFDRSNLCNALSPYPLSDAILACPGRPVNGHVYAINTGDGSLKWDFKTCGASDSSPAIGADGTVYIGSRHPVAFCQNANCSTLGSEGSTTTGFIYAIIDNGNIGTLKCVKDLLGDVDSSPAVGSDGTIYVGSDDFHVWALPPVCPAPNQWTEKWVKPTKDKVKSSPAIASDGLIYVGSNDKSLYAFDPEGTARLRFIAEGSVNSSPSIAPDGTIYLGSSDNKVHALFGTKGSSLAETPWPKFRRDLPNTGRH